MKSEICRYFGPHGDKDGKPINNGTAVCHICYCDVLAKAGNTSNIISHFCLKHPSVYAQSSFSIKRSISFKQCSATFLSGFAKNRMFISNTLSSFGNIIVYHLYNIS